MNGSMKNGLDEREETIELNDESGDEEEDDDDGDVMIIDEPKENGSIGKVSTSDELEVIELDSGPVKTKKKHLKTIVPRRSVRNINKQRSYVEEEKDEEPRSTTSPRSDDVQEDEESDIEEIMPQDPLAMSSSEVKRPAKMSTNSSTIVVKDTKRLVEIAAKSNNSNTGR